MLPSLSCVVDKYNASLNNAMAPSCNPAAATSDVNTMLVLHLHFFPFASQSDLSMMRFIVSGSLPWAGTSLCLLPSWPAPYHLTRT
uniref:Uncharacterized protein n=1 Tax=Oryza sativa subsp. japonica TaxID=39947 RepID=Q5VMF3_ORYSJ|nr:hypothetical protein [Oryza sativa Japonica Group]